MKHSLFLNLIFLGLMIIMASCSEDHLDSTIDSDINKSLRITDDLIDLDADFQMEANRKLELLIEFFEKTRYPDFYGGAYINKEGKLVILIKRNKKHHIDGISRIIGDQDVLFKLCRNSFNDLVGSMNHINTFLKDPKNFNWLNEIDAFTMMDESNKIIVELALLNQENIQKFKTEILDYKAIEFEQSSGKVVEESLNPGCSVSEGGFSASLGFRAKNGSGDEGMVVSGHQFASVGDEAFQDGFRIGTCTITSTSGSVDAAFVKIDDVSVFTPSNIMCNTRTSRLSTTTSRPGVGTFINKRGFATGRTGGNITSTNSSFTSSRGNFYTNMTKANYSSAGGDSGAPVYSFISSTGTLLSVGIHLGRNSTGAFFSKADLVLSKLNVSRY